MFNTTTRTYTNRGHDGTFDWIIEDVDVEGITQESAEEWADLIISNTIEQDLNEMEEDAPVDGYPKMGYSTTHFYNDVDDYIAQKTEEITRLKAEKGDIVAFLLEATNNV